MSLDQAALDCILGYSTPTNYILGTEVITDPSFDDPLEWTLGVNWNITAGVLSASVASTLAVGTLVTSTGPGFYEVTVNLTTVPGDTAGVKIYHFSQGTVRSNIVKGDGDQSYITYTNAAASGTGIWIESLGPISINSISVKQITPQGTNFLPYGRFDETVALDYAWEEGASNSPAITINSALDSITFSPGIQHIENKSGRWDEDTLLFFTLTIDRADAGSFDFTIAGEQTYTVSNAGQIEGAINTKTRTSPSQSLFSIDSTTFDGDITDIIIREAIHEECDNLAIDPDYSFGDSFWNIGSGWAISNNTLVCSGGTGSVTTKSSNHEQVTTDYFILNFTVSGYVSGDLKVYLGGTLSSTINSDGFKDVFDNLPLLAGSTDIIFESVNFIGTISPVNLYGWMPYSTPDCTELALWGVNCPYTPPPEFNPGEEFIIKNELSVSSSYLYTLPIFGSVLPLYCLVDWDDGSPLEIVTSDAPTHTYDTTIKQIFYVSVAGYCPKVCYNDVTNASANVLKDITQWGKTGFDFLEWAFQDCDYLTYITATDGGGSTFTGVTSFRWMFGQSNNLVGIDVSNWDVSNITSIYYMFGQCAIYTIDVSNWDTSSLENMGWWLGANPSAQVNGIENWDTSNLLITGGAFYDNRTNEFDLSSWDVSKVSNARSMFEGARVVSFSVAAWDMSNLMDGDFMFYGAIGMNPDAHLWTVPQLTTAQSMLAACGLTCEKYGMILEAWSRQKLQPNVNFTYQYGNLYHPKFEPFRDVLIERDRWEFAEFYFPDDFYDGFYGADYCEERYECLCLSQNTEETNWMMPGGPELLADPEFYNPGGEWTMDPEWSIVSLELVSTIAGGEAHGELLVANLEAGFYQLNMRVTSGTDGFNIRFPEATSTPIFISTDDRYTDICISVPTAITGAVFILDSLGVAEIAYIYLNKVSFPTNDLVLLGCPANMSTLYTYWAEDPLNSPAIYWSGYGDRDSLVFSPGIQNLYNKNNQWEENTLYYFAVCYEYVDPTSVWPFSIGGGIFFSYSAKVEVGGNFEDNNAISGVSNSRTRTSDLQGIFNVESTVADIEITQMTVRPYVPACDNLIIDGYFLSLDTFWNIAAGCSNANKDSYLTCVAATGLTYTKEHNTAVFAALTEFKYHVEVKDFEGGYFNLYAAGSNTLLAKIEADGIYEGIAIVGIDQTYDIGFSASGFTGKIFNVWLKKSPDCDSGASCSFGTVYGIPDCDVGEFDGCGNKIYTANPSLVLADFIRSSFYGEGATINQDGVNICAASNDELVDDRNGGTEKRREVGYIIDTVADTQTHKDDIRKYAGVFLTYEEGELKMIPDRPTDVIAFDFDEDSIVVGSLKLRQRTGRDTATSSRVSYTKVNDDLGVEYDFWRKGYATATEQDAVDGLIPWREDSIDMHGIQKLSQADREAEERLNRSLLVDLDVSFIGFDPALKVQLGDVITVTHPIGLVAYKFRVRSAQFVSLGRYKIQGYTYDPAVYVS